MKQARGSGGHSKRRDDNQIGVKPLSAGGSEHRSAVERRESRGARITGSHRRTALGALCRQGAWPPPRSLSNSLRSRGRNRSRTGKSVREPIRRRQRSNLARESELQLLTHMETSSRIAS
jgi:hypothetical protein